MLVTDDSKLESQLRERVDGLTSRELAECAHGLGLYHPGYGERMNPPIALVWPAGMDDDDDGLLMRDIGDSDED